jgi:hypothetical protein
MRVIHRVSLSDDAERRRILSSVAVAFNTSQSPLVPMLWFDIDETHPAWQEVRQWIAEWQAGDIVQAKFTSRELSEATYLQISPGWHYGYPQPEDDFGFLEATYDLSAYCPTCGIGKKQVAPFRMKSEPNWGKKHFLQLNWVFDEFFILPKVWEEIFKPLGVDGSPVVEHRTGKPLRTVVQLDIKNVATSALSIKQFPSETCGRCERKKYLAISGGFFPAFVADTSSRLCKTQECFGSGGSAWHAVVVSSEVYRAIEARKLAGLTFVPLSPSS